LKSLKGSRYIIKAAPIGISGAKTKSLKFVAVKTEKKTVTLEKLKTGLWSFSYTVTRKKSSIASCPVEKTVR